MGIRHGALSELRAVWCIHPFPSLLITNASEISTNGTRIARAVQLAITIGAFERVPLLESFGEPSSHVLAQILASKRSWNKAS